MGGTTAISGPISGPATNNENELEYKAAASPERLAAGLISAEDATGVVEALVSVTGVYDDVDDIIEPGAYTKTLANRRPKGIFSHDWNQWLARTEECVELLPGDPRLPKQTKDGKTWPAEAGALYVKARFNLKSSTAHDAYEQVKFFSETDECDWSIGYKVPRGAGMRGKDGKRRITEVDLYEYSPVLFGAAGPFTGSLSVKDANATDPSGAEDGAEGHDDGEAGEAPGRAGDGAQEGAEPPDGADSGDDPDWEALDAAATGLLAGKEADGGGWQSKRFVPKGKRDQMAKAGTAMPDGSYPIETIGDLKNAVQAYGRANEQDRPAVKKHIIKRAKALKATNMLPDAWDADGGSKSVQGKGADTSVHIPLNVAPGKNWVEDSGQLPAYVQHVAKALATTQGMPLEKAIPTAIAAMYRWAAGKGGVSADTQAKAAEAIAEWNELRAKSKARTAARRAGDAAAQVTKDALADLQTTYGSGAGEADADADGFDGTFEELRDTLAESAGTVLDPDRSAMVDVIGTWPDRFIAARFTLDGSAVPDAFEIPYRFADGGVVLGDPVPVEVTVEGEDDGGGDGGEGSLLPYGKLLDDVGMAVKALLLTGPGDPDATGDGGLEGKAGRVLSAANATRLKSAVETLITVLGAAGVHIDNPAAESANDDSGGTDGAATVSDSTAPSAQVKTAGAAEGMVLVEPGLQARALRIVADSYC